MNLGNIRELMEEEKLEHPDFIYVVTEECKCVYNDKEIVVPPGFLTDGSSGGPDYGWSWLFHDYLYTTHLFANGSHCSRREADTIMYHILRYERQNMYAFAYLMATKIAPCIFAKHWKNDDQNDHFIK